MKKTELIEKLNGCSIEFYVNLELSGFGDNEDEDDWSADELPNVEYYIKDGKLFSWDNKEIIDIKDVIYEDEDYDEKQTLYNLVTDIIDIALEKYYNEDCDEDCESFSGAPDFDEMLSNEWILMVLIKNGNDDIVYEIDDYDIADEVG